MDVSQIEVKDEVNGHESSEIGQILDLVSRTDGRQALSDHLQLDFAAGGTHGFAALLRRDAHGNLEAYGQLSRSNEARLFELVVHPDHRDRADSIEAELLATALDTVASSGGGPISWWVSEPTARHHSLARDAGLHPTRELFQMRRPLPTERHATIDTRPFRPGVDDAAWLAVNNRAFADHGEQGGWTHETLTQRLHEAWFDPDGFRIHERDGRMAGFCWTKVHDPRDVDGGTPLGEIYVIAVDPDFHGLGLGSEMTLAGLDHLAAAGIETALLYVDASNDAAVSTYRRLGFDVVATNAAFSAHIAANLNRTPSTGTHP